MNVKSLNGILIFSNPITSAEGKFLDTIHQIIKETGRKTVEFSAASMGEDKVTHVWLQPIIPEGFQEDGLGGIERVNGCCPCGEDH